MVTWSYCMQSPLECSLLGVVKRQSKERAVEVKTDPSGGYLGCLVSHVPPYYTV